MKRTLLYVVLLLLTTFFANAQKTALEEIRENPGRSGGVYYAYPVPTDVKLTPAPKAISPFTSVIMVVMVHATC